MNKYGVYYETIGRLGTDIVDGKSRVDAERELSKKLGNGVQFVRAERVFKQVDGQYTKRSGFPQTKEMMKLDELEDEISNLWKELRLYEQLIEHLREFTAGKEVDSLVRKTDNIHCKINLLKTKCDSCENKIFGK